MTGERACSRPWQDKHQVPEWGDYGITRGLRGIPGRPPGGHQPLHHSRKEGHYNDQRYPTGAADLGREVIIQVLMGPQKLVLFGTTTSSKRCIPMKAIPKISKKYKIDPK